MQRIRLHTLSASRIPSSTSLELMDEASLRMLKAVSHLHLAERQAKKLMLEHSMIEQILFNPHQALKDKIKNEDRWRGDNPS